jgi:transposase
MTTYSQDWPAYNAAKSNEDSLFKQLLIELALACQEERTPRVGRTGYFSWEKVVSMTLKEYYKSDLRKTESILKSLAQAQRIPRVANFRTISTFYNDKALTALLERLVLMSALPLAGVEVTGAIDSTGFAVRRYKSWNEYKWGKHEGKERIWVKLHAWAGTTTNIFVGAKVTPGNAGDAPMFQEVVGNSPLYFQMREFVADKAYSSRAILDFLGDLGIDPYIPFKKNTTGKSGGSRLWREMYLHFRRSPEIFMEAYHQRSNIETCFHMLKARFGDHLLTRNFVANQNEILTKMLCHNLCVLIQEAYERGIQPNFAACLQMQPRVQKPL